MMIFLIAILYGMKPEIVFASEYGSRGVDTLWSEMLPPTKISESLSTSIEVESSGEVIANQQNECQGNFVICQNILAKFICTQKAICIIGNLDPFLLVLPK